MLHEFLNPHMNASFVRIKSTLKLSAKAGLHYNDWLCLKVCSYGKCFNSKCPRHLGKYSIFIWSLCITKNMLKIYILYVYFSYYFVLSDSAFKTFLRTRVEPHSIEIKEIKGNNKITELRTILQRESQNS
jgi:hypothetical protein